MNTFINNVFYVFDDNGWYLWFFNCLITKLYWLNIKEAESEGAVMIIIAVEGRKEESSTLN